MDERPHSLTCRPQGRTFIEDTQSEPGDCDEAMREGIFEDGGCCDDDFDVGQNCIPEALVCPLLNTVGTSQETHTVSRELQIQGAVLLLCQCS